MDNFGIILAGGIGSRMKSEIPKQYLKILDKEIIEYSINAFNQSKLLDDFIVVTDSETHKQYVSDRYHVATILGGQTRNESFQNALNYIAGIGGCKNIFVNEAARPMITAELIDDFLVLVENASCVYCVKEVTDSLEHEDGTYADRTKYNLVMSPEAYNFRDIIQYFDPTSNTTFPGHTLPRCCKKVRYQKYSKNIKITYPEDLVKFQSLLTDDNRS